MGMFDTIIFDSPIQCPTCGESIHSGQVKWSEPCLNVFRTGDFVRSSSVFHGVVEDDFYCDKCKEIIPIYYMIWNSILAGARLDREVALLDLSNIDRLDMLNWLEQTQSRLRDLQANYRRFYNDLHGLHEHLQSKKDAVTGNEDSKRFVFALRFHQLPEDVLNSEDPIAELLKIHKPDPEDESGFGGLGCVSS